MNMLARCVVRCFSVCVYLLIVTGTCLTPRVFEGVPSEAGRSIHGLATGLTASSLADFKYIAQVKSIAALHRVDYRLILAIIMQESRLEEDAVSHRGAFGLMQLMPRTYEQIEGELDQIDSTNDPLENIEAGAYYFSRLLEMYKEAPEEDRVKLALAAYNCGPGRIEDARKIAEYMQDDCNRWESVCNALRLLSKRYYSLHHSVWATGRPTNGYFRDWRQTSAYVAGVMEKYQEILVAEEQSQPPKRLASLR